MARFIFIFVDGVGIGRADQTNPFYVGRSDFLPFYDNHSPGGVKVVIKAIDPLLGIEGMPSSATGQTTLFTGINIPAAINQHKGSYPDKYMRKILKRSNLLYLLDKCHYRVRFLNAYPRHSELFSSRHLHIHDNGELEFSSYFPAEYRRRISTTTCMLLSLSQRPFDEVDIIAERSLYHDYSNRELIERGLPLPVFSPETAAEVMARTAGDYDLLLYEYFLTDMYGHGFPLQECVDLVERLNRFIKHLISILNEKEDTLLLTSDHGNLEDMDSRIHTFNSVPMIAWGRGSENLRKHISTIADVTPAILNHFNI